MTWTNNSIIYWKMGSVQSSQQPHLSTQPCGIRTLESFARWSRRGATLVQKEARCPMIPDYKALKRIVLSKEDDLQFIETSKHYPSYSLFKCRIAFPLVWYRQGTLLRGSPNSRAELLLWRSKPPVSASTLRSHPDPADMSSFDVSQRSGPLRQCKRLQAGMEWFGQHFGRIWIVPGTGTFIRRITNATHFNSRDHVLHFNERTNYYATPLNSRQISYVHMFRVLAECLSKLYQFQVRVCFHRSVPRS